MEMQGREREIGANATVSAGPGGSAGPEQQGRRVAPNRSARLLAGGAILLAAIVVLVLVFSSGSSYTTRLVFSDASGLVNGDQVFIGPSSVGTVKSIALTRDGQAAVTISLDSDAAPLYTGTVARIEENGLAGVASHYITIQPASTAHPQIPSGGTIPSTHTYAEVGLDQLFNSLNGKTRDGLANIIQGESASIKGHAQAANRTIEYLAPALQSTAEVTKEIDRNEPAFDALLVNGAKSMQTLASRSEQLTDLVEKADETTGAIATQSQNLKEALSLLPDTLARSTTTEAGLRQTLRVLTPLVQRSIPAVKNLKPFSQELSTFATTALPTLSDLSALIASKNGHDLTGLLRQAGPLEAVLRVAFPNIEKSIKSSAPQIDYLRDYTPDIVAALADLGNVSGYYNANGHYARAAPFFGAYGSTTVGGQLQLTQRDPDQRYKGLQVVRSGRCPGSGTQAPAGDSSMPEKVKGCSTSNDLPGS
jgi:phospholipid/cholesterol/gamma-HCH transport system substrate-binding protein